MMKILPKLRRFRIGRIVKNEIGREGKGREGKGREGKGRVKMVLDLKWHAKEPQY